MRRIVTTSLFGLALAWPLLAQSKPPVTRADYGQFETLSFSGGGGGRRGGGGGGANGFSPDGKWLAYAITRGSRSNELDLVRLSDNTTSKIPSGGQQTFSSDSKWMAYSVVPDGEAGGRRGGAPGGDPNATGGASPAPQPKVAIRNLASGDTTTVDGIQAFSFSPDAQYIVMRRVNPAPAAAAAAGGAGAGRGPAGAGGGGRGAGGAAAEAPVGGTIIVRQLATGHDTTFGNVGEYAWQDFDRSHLLAMTISAADKVGNGVQLFDPETTVLRVLESSAAAYTGLVWRADAPDLAVYREKMDARHDGPTAVVLAWTGVGKGAEEHLQAYDPTGDSAFPAGMHTVTFRRAQWSDDGKTIYLGVATWDEVIAAPPGRGRAGGGRGASTAEAPPALSNGARASAPIVDEPASVDIWHWTDIFVQPRQKLSAAADRRRNLLAAWHLDTNTFIQLSKSYDESVAPMRHANTAYVAEWSKYAMDRTIGRPSADTYIEDLTTGARTKLKENINEREAQLGPAGKYFLYLQDDTFWTINLATKAATNISKGVPAQFIDKESDETVKQKPAFGVAGWTKDDAAVLLYDKYDIWKVPSDGSKATKLTDGAAEGVRYRLTRVGQDEDWTNLEKPVYLTTFGLLSKKAGYGLLKPAGGVDRLLWADQTIGNLAKARDAEVYAYTAQDYDDSPDLFVAGPDLKNAKQVSATNAFLANYAWGKSQTIDFVTDKGLKLQGSLYYPAGYEAPRPGSEQAGKTYPMIVYLYEKLSDNVHRFVVPTDRDYYNISVFMSQGYFVFEPDIVFRPRQPGLSVVECVTAGVKKVTSMGPVDPKRVGVVGHSWGGFDTAFLATHTTGVFAAAVAGAPITDLVSNYGNHHWSSGIAETDHIETGQQRMEVPLYEDLPDYIANSAVFNAANMTVPLMIEVGDADGTVFWHQGIELFNIARRAKKNVVLLQYEGEDHGLRQAKNQIDYQQRILAWFGYYLKGDEPQKWITSGETFLERDAEMKKATAGGRGGH